MWLQASVICHVMLPDAYLQPLVVMPDSITWTQLTAGTITHLLWLPGLPLHLWRYVNFMM